MNVPAKQSTKKKIVDKAEKLMWFQGYDGTSLNELVSKAGVSKGAFFHYYPNKQAISQEIIDQYFEQHLMTPLKDNLQQASTIKNGLFNWIMGFFNTFKDHQFKGGCLLGNLALELSDQNEAARQTTKQHFLELENILTNALRPYKAKGKLLMDPRQTARLIIAAFQGTAMTTKVHKDKNRASREFQAIAELIEYTIKD